MSDWKERFADKVMDADAAMGLINRGDYLYVGGGAATPTPLLEALTRQHDRLIDHDVASILMLGPAPHVQPQFKGIFRHNALFIGPNVREAVNQGYADYTPIFLSEIPRMFRNGRIPVDVALIQLSPPDRHGYCSLGVDVAISRGAVAAAKVVIAEINPQMPRTWGHTFIHVDRIDALVPSDRPLLELHGPEITEETDKIGRHVADLVEDGATLQLGIGHHPRFGPGLPGRQEGPGRPHRAVQRRPDGTHEATGHHRPAQDPPPRQGGDHPGDRFARAI